MKAFTTLLVFTFLVGIVYYQLDRNLFYYGKNDLHLYNLLPFHITPDDRPVWEGGFALRDSAGFTIAADGNTYPLNDKTIKIKKVLKYGFDTENLIAFVNDDRQRTYCVKFHQNQKDKSDFDVHVNVDCAQDTSRSYTWISIDGNDKHITRLALCRNWLMFIMILSIPLLGYLMFGFRKRKK